jgi:hypothetical protein
MIVITRMHFICLALVGIAGCRSSELGNKDTTATRANDAVSDSTASLADCGTGARHVIAQLGERMRRVSLLAPDSVVKHEIAEAYSALASPALLSAWQATPASAPGRDVSSPWPARIEIRAMQPDGRVCRVEGDVVYVTNADTIVVAERRAVTIRLNPRDSLRITAYEVLPRSADHTSSGSLNDNATAAADVVRQYYQAITAHDYDRAYALWGQSGRASGKTRAEFVAGFARTVEVRLTIRGVPRMEGAAGSQYATVSVAVDAVQSDGQKQRFTGTYTLRRAVADGATPEQRAWHIYTAALTS